MSLEETAKQVIAKITEIRDKSYEIMHIGELVTSKHVLNGETVEFSDTDKEKLLDYYRTKKAELQTLVNELP